MVKAAVERKKVSWKEVLGARDKVVKDMYGGLQRRKEEG